MYVLVYCYIWCGEWPPMSVKPHKQSRHLLCKPLFWGSWWSAISDSCTQPTAVHWRSYIEGNTLYKPHCSCMLASISRRNACVLAKRFQASIGSAGASRWTPFVWNSQSSISSPNPNSCGCPFSPADHTVSRNRSIVSFCLLKLICFWTMFSVLVKNWFVPLFRFVLRAIFWRRLSSSSYHRPFAENEG